MKKQALALTALLCLLALPLGLPATAEPPLTPTQASQTQWWINALNLPQAWNITKGQGTKICLIDDPVDTTHPALKNTRITTVPTNTSSEPKLSEHGTAMAGLIASTPNSGHTYAGIAPEVELITVAIAERGSAELPSTAIDSCLAARATVISMSIASGIKVDDLKRLEAKDVVVIKAMGNVEQSAAWDGHFGVVYVGGVDSNLKHDPGASSRAWGKVPHAASDDFPYQAGVTLAGPYSIAPGQCPGGLGLNGTYVRGCGTSNATAIVAGVVALVRAKYPEMNAANVINRILKTAKPLETPIPSPRTGVGFPDAYAALTADIPPVHENPLGSMATGSGGQFLPEATPTTTPTPNEQTPTKNNTNPWTWVSVAISLLTAVALSIYATTLSRRKNTPPLTTPPAADTMWATTPHPQATHQDHRP